MYKFLFLFFRGSANLRAALWNSILNVFITLCARAYALTYTLPVQFHLVHRIFRLSRNLFPSFHE